MRKLRPRLKYLAGFCFLVAALAATSGWVMTWPGRTLRIAPSHITVNSTKASAIQYVAIANPTLQTIKIEIEPACGCAQVTAYGKLLGPLQMTRWTVTSDYVILRKRPLEQTILDIKCSTPSGKWTEQIYVEAFK